MKEHHITVPRTARYHIIGDAANAHALWIVLHGYGQLARFFLRPFEGLEGTRLIAAPEGLSRFYTDADHSRMGATWMTREDRDAEIADQASYLNALAESLLAQCPPGTPLHVLGFSQGVATACRWAVANTSPISRLVLWGGSMPPELLAPALAAKWQRSPITLVHGNADTIVGIDKLEESEARLRDAHVPFRTVQFAGGHVLNRLVLKQVLEDAP